MALKLGIYTYEILTNDGEVCTSSVSSILLNSCNISWVMSLKMLEKQGSDYNRSIESFYKNSPRPLYRTVFVQIIFWECSCDLIWTKTEVKRSKLYVFKMIE